MKRLLCLTPYPMESASERHRIYQFLPYLERAGFVCAVRPFATPTLFRAIQDERLAPKLLHTPFCCLRRALDLAAIRHYDAVMIHREAFPFLTPLVEKMVLRRHSRVIFSFDDAVHIGHQDIVAKKYSWIHKLKYGAGVNEVLRQCAHVIAGNQVLADHARQFHPRVSIIPTVVDLNRYTCAPPKPADEVLTVGWCGSRSTSPYLAGIEPALRRLSEAHPGRIRFRFYGHPQCKLNLPDFASLPFSLAAEMENLRGMDIGIMPMPSDDWTRGKCGFKTIQYMAMGIPAVASPVGMACELVQQNRNGFLARTVDEWFQALHNLVQDAALRRRFAVEGRRTIERSYSLQVWAPRLVALFEEIVGDRATTEGRLAVGAACT